MCECSFMNQICTNIVIISRLELPNKIARNHQGRKGGESVGWKSEKQTMHHHCWQTLQACCPQKPVLLSLLMWKCTYFANQAFNIACISVVYLILCQRKWILVHTTKENHNGQEYEILKHQTNMSNCQYPTWLLIKFAKVWHPRMWIFSCLLSRSSVRTFTRLMAKYALHQQAHSSMHKNWAIENSWEAISIAINGILVLAKNFANSHLLFTNEE